MIKLQNDKVFCQLADIHETLSWQVIKSTKWLNDYTPKWLSDKMTKCEHEN